MSKTKIGPNEREDAKRSQWRNRHKSWLVDWIYYIFHYLNDVDVKGNWIHIDSFKKNLSVGMTVINHDRCLRLDCSIFFWFHLSRLSASIYSNTKWIRIHFQSWNCVEFRYLSNWNQIDADLNRRDIVRIRPFLWLFQHRNGANPIQVKSLQVWLTSFSKRASI